ENTRGIGSKIWLYGGAAPVQSQEVICGGRYLSCDDAMRVFAAGTETNRMRIEVRWRGGKRSVVEGVRANREYEISEEGAEKVQSSKFKVQSDQSSVVSGQSLGVEEQPACVFEDGPRITDHGQPRNSTWSVVRETTGNFQLS